MKLRTGFKWAAASAVTVSAVVATVGFANAYTLDGASIPMSYNSSGTSGWFDSGSNTSSYSGSNSYTPTNSEVYEQKVNGEELSWDDIIKLILEGEGEMEIEMTDGNTYVSSNVVQAIKDSERTIKFKVGGVTVIVDGKQIDKVRYLSLDISAVVPDKSGYNFSVIGGSVIEQLLVSDVGVPVKLQLTLTADSIGKFGNMMKIDTKTGSLKFIDVSVVDEEGKLILSIDGKGSYFIIIDTETKMPGDIDNNMESNAKDASAILLSLISDNSVGEYKGDVNGDGDVNAKDAAYILSMIVNS